MNEYVAKTYEGKQTGKVIDLFKIYCKNHPKFLGNLHDLNFMVSTSEQDMHNSIDLTVVNVKKGISKNIAIRCRGEEYLRYADFTIRSLTKNGSYITELHKIKSGKSYCNYYFYCWCADKSDNHIIQHILVDVDKLIEKDVFNKKWTERMNDDGSKFIAISRKLIHDSGAMIYDSFSPKIKPKIIIKGLSKYI